MDPIEETIESLILSGAVEVTAIDSKTGEPLYAFTPKIKKIMPRLYEQHITEVNKDIMVLWEKGFLEIDMLMDNPLVTLSDKAFVKENINSLSDQLQISLLEIKRLLLK